MKKSFEKFLAIATGTLNVLFLILLALVIYKKIDIADLDNSLLITLLSVLGAINIVLIGFVVTNAFIDNETLAAVMLFSDKTSSTKASINVVKKIVRRSAKQLGNIKVGKIALFLEENNGLRMRIAVKIREDQVENAIDKFRCLLIDEFSNILEIEFNSIDFKVTALKTNYSANLSKVEEQARGLQQEREAKQAQEKAKKLAIEQEEQVDIIAEVDISTVTDTQKVDASTPTDAPSMEEDAVCADLLEEVADEDTSIDTDIELDTGKDIDVAESTGNDLSRDALDKDASIEEEDTAEAGEIDTAESTGADNQDKLED